MFIKFRENVLADFGHDLKGFGKKRMHDKFTGFLKAGFVMRSFVLGKLVERRFGMLMQNYVFGLNFGDLLQP